MKYRWVRLEDIVRWLDNDMVTEINFTGDGFVADDIEPEGWYGMKLSKEFDGNSMIFGDWGLGIIHSDNLDDGIAAAIKGFFKNEFGWEIYFDTHICCEAKGLPVAEKYKDCDDLWVVKFNNEKMFDCICIETEDEAENLRLALETAYEYGREVGK